MISRLTGVLLFLVTSFALGAVARGQCSGDIDGSGAVSAADLSTLLGAWGPCQGCAADLDADGQVAASDLSLLLAGWGPCPPPWATVLEQVPDPAVVTSADLRQAIIATGLPWRVRDNASQIEMLLVPPGTFDMGCSASEQNGCNGDENPVRSVTLTNAFYMGRYEVTQAQWTAVMGANPSWFQGASKEVPVDQVALRPVEQVSWNMVQDFNTATGLRLPTEAEWEYACRAGTTTAFHSFSGHPFGTNDEALLEAIAWSGGNSAGQTRPVGQKLPNALGLYDILGNAWEWVSDFYSTTYDGSSPSVNPLGPSVGTQRVLRGGMWLFGSNYCRVSYRVPEMPQVALIATGFRVARSASFAIPAITSVTPAHGLPTGGTTITITGANLIHTTSVTVGGVAATSVTIVSDTHITAVTPAGAAGEAAVAVTTLTGTSTQPVRFLYTTVPPWATVLEQVPDPAVVTSADLRQAIIATGWPWRVRDNASQIEMLLVPPGTFDMGCSGSNLYECASDELPVHTVTLTNAFYIGRYEVTQAQWQAVMGSNPSSNWYPTRAVPADQVPLRPVELVSWGDVQYFNAATGLRLPTEAEWEFAYRGGTTTAFHAFTEHPHGTNNDSLFGNIAWFDANSSVQPRPVGGKQGNSLGLHDMSGNVNEYVNDRYSSTYYSESPSTDPLGPETGGYRVVRGGSCNFDSYARASYRALSGESDNSPFTGFRAARNP
jgi:formylglycine-generating enzyme required for sulfatase activity